MVKKIEMKRDFSGENLLTFFFRVTYAVFLRLRGFFYKYFFIKVGRGLSIAPGLLLMNPKGILLGDKVHFGRMARLESYDNRDGKAKVMIGDNCNFGDFFHISACNSIFIGSNCLFASKVMIIDFGHGRAGDSDLRKIPPQDRPRFSKDGIEIGSNVWVGEGVTIFAGAKVPDGVIIPAHSFVDGNFTNYV